MIIKNFYSPKYIVKSIKREATALEKWFWTTYMKSTDIQNTYTKST